MQTISAQALAQRLSDESHPRPVLLDVREGWELQTCALPGVLHIPMQTIPARIEELNPADEVICICHHGMRSMQVALFLEHHGFKNVINLSGGMHAWAVQVDPQCPTY